MRISVHGFFRAHHSWSMVNANVARSLLKLGHTVDVCPTDGLLTFPEDLKPNIKSELDSNYDMQLSYTAMKNFPLYLSHGKKNRLGIWAWEFDGKNALPDGFAKNYKNCDYLLPPSNFAKQVFANSGIPESSMKVIPHGIDFEDFSNNGPVYPLKTKKKYKILYDIAQPHIRKNLDGMLEIWGKAFKKTDDVCLVIKVVDKKPEQQFEVSFSKLFQQFVNKYKQHAEIEVISEFIPRISDLYRACDILFFPTRAECFTFPVLQAIVMNKVPVVSNYGGHLDFANQKNSLLIEGDIVRAPPTALYWQNKINTVYFEPKISDAVDKLKYTVSNYDKLKEDFSMYNKSGWLNKYSWDAITKNILELCGE